MTWDEAEKLWPDCSVEWDVSGPGQQGHAAAIFSDDAGHLFAMCEDDAMAWGWDPGLRSWAMRFNLSGQKMTERCQALANVMDQDKWLARIQAQQDARKQQAQRKLDEGRPFVPQPKHFDFNDIVKTVSEEEDK